MGIKKTDFMGAIPAVAGRLPDDMKGFAVGMLPGMIYKGMQGDKDKEEEIKQLEKELATMSKNTGTGGARMAAGGKVPMGYGKARYNRK